LLFILVVLKLIEIPRNSHPDLSRFTADRSEKLGIAPRKYGSATKSYFGAAKGGFATSCKYSFDHETLFPWGGNPILPENKVLGETEFSIAIYFSHHIFTFCITGLTGQFHVQLQSK